MCIVRESLLSYSFTIILLLEATMKTIVCDLLVDGNELINKEEPFLHKIVDESSIEPPIIYDYRSNFQYPTIFQNQPQVQYVPADATSLKLNQLQQQQQYYILYSIPIESFATTNFLPYSDNTNIYDFSNQYKDPYYESNGEEFRDNPFISKPVSNIQQQVNELKYNNAYRDITYIPFEEYSGVEPDSYLPQNALTSNSEKINKTQIKFQNVQHDCLKYGHYTTLKPKPQNFFSNFGPPKSSKRPPFGQKHTSENIEIVKAIRYELPVKSSTYQPVPSTRSYFFDSSSITPLDPKLNGLKKAQNDWKKQQESYTYTGDPIIVIDDVEADSSDKPIASQYFLSNRKPITFESPENDVQNVTASLGAVTETYDISTNNPLEENYNKTIINDLNASESTSEKYSVLSKNISVEIV